MSGDRPGSQCGLTSLLPMSCRGRAAAFARDLHSRLRNLGGAHDDENESNWLAPDDTSLRPAASNHRDLDTFYDFELECESPSSPVDEFDPPFAERSQTVIDDPETPFYDVDSGAELKEQIKQVVQQPDKKRNGFKFSTAFYTDSSPVKQQPSPRDNGHSDKRLYSPITFEGCARKCSVDEVDCAPRSKSPDLDQPSLPLIATTLDSDSEFESAKSEPSDIVDEAFAIKKSLDNDVTEVEENLSPAETAVLSEEEASVSLADNEHTPVSEETNECLEIIASKFSDTPEKEISPEPEIEPSLLCAETTVDDRDDAEDHRPQRIRRCSSLKTGKTPPGTPGRKKIVRFADVLGLDLADVKTFMDDIPVIPKSAYDDLTGCDAQSSPPAARAPQRLGSLTLVPLFQLPVDLTQKLEYLNVCMESARVCDGVHVTVCGSVRVRNLDFHKTVHIRYTMNRWKTYTDLQATYVAGSCDGFSDRFQFMLYAPCISSGQRLEIAVRFQCKGQQFWDNNSGANYCFDCLALGATSRDNPSGPLDATLDWHPSFY